MSRPTIPTSVCWCKEVPEDWGFAPLRQLGAVVSGGTPSGDEENWNGDIPFITPPDLRPVVGGSVSKTERTLTRSAAESGSAVVPANTVLVSIRAPIGYVARTTMEAAFNQGCRALVPKSGVDSTYLTYALVAAGPELESLGRGSTFTELSAAQFSAIKVPSPPLDEQRAIADYLDRETARIDTLIAEIGTSIALSGERRSALITTAVTGQIDVTGTAVRLRDSEDSQRKDSQRSREVSPTDLPVGWSSVPLKRLARVVSGATPKTEVKEHWDGDVVWVTPADMGKSDSHYLAASDRTLSRSGLAGCSAELLPKGAVIVSTRAPIGTIGIADVPLTTNQGCKGLVFREGDSRFFAYQLSGVTELLNSYGSGSTFLELSSERLKSFAVVCPPLSEQRAIADHLDRETARIDTLIAEQRQLVELARERRSALITAAVTGQIDVRKAS